MIKPKRASEDALEELHSELAGVLKKGLTIRDDDGRPIAALLNVARQFLKDNRIEGPPAPKSPLPVFDDDDFSDTATPH